MANKYMLFANANREAVRTAHPDWPMTKVMQELGRMYRAKYGVAKSPKAKSPKRKSPKRKSPKRKSPKAKSPKRKSPKRKSPKRRRK